MVDSLKKVANVAGGLPVGAGKSVIDVAAPVRLGRHVLAGNLELAADGLEVVFHLTVRFGLEGLSAGPVFQLSLHKDAPHNALAGGGGQREAQLYLWRQRRTSG